MTQLVERDQAIENITASMTASLSGATPKQRGSLLLGGPGTGKNQAFHEAGKKAAAALGLVFKTPESDDPANISKNDLVFSHVTLAPAFLGEIGMRTTTQAFRDAAQKVATGLGIAHTTPSFSAADEDDTPAKVHAALSRLGFDCAKAGAVIVLVDGLADQEPAVINAVISAIEQPSLNRAQVYVGATGGLDATVGAALQSHFTVSQLEWSLPRTPSIIRIRSTSAAPQAGGVDLAGAPGKPKASL